MKKEFIIIPIRRGHGRLVRALALFFVLFTGADIALPQYFCGGEEVGGLPLGSVATSTSEDSLPGQVPDEAPHEEDCFCCCAHVLPGLAFIRAATAELRSLEPPQKHESLPTPPLQLPYHPPRFA
jgi:hypothetical protein